MQGCCKPFKNPLQEHRQVAGYLQGGGAGQRVSNLKSESQTRSNPLFSPLFPAISRFQTHSSNINAQKSAVFSHTPDFEKK